MEKREKLSVGILIVFSILIFLILLNLKYTGFTILNQFNNSLTTENLNFTDSITENITRYISLNKNVNISSAYLNLTGSSVYSNQTDGFNLELAGSRTAMGITTNGSDFWVIDNDDDFVYHFNRNGSNQTDGFYIGDAGAGVGEDLVTNGSDFWITDTTDKFVYHFNRTGANQSDGFYSSLNGAGGITTNGSDFWIADWNNYFVAHFNRTGANQTDGFYIGDQSDCAIGMTSNNSDFWITDCNDDFFVAHFNSSGDNQTDGFDVGAIAKITYAAGITTNVTLTGGTPKDFWIVDGTYDFMFHIKLLYISNPHLDIGNDSTQEWNHTGDFTLVNNKTADFASAINTYLSSCTADSSGNCSVPFIFHSDSTGKIQYSDLKIDYSDISDPTASLTPSADTTVSFGGTISLTCSGSDNVGVSSVSLTVAGESFCSGTSSCSGTYTMSTSGSKTVTCSVTDTSGRSASSSITLSTGGTVGGGGPSSGGGGTTEPAPVEEEIPILEQPVQQIYEETNIEIPELAYDTINIPAESITSSISDNSIIVNLGDLASLVYSYVDVSGVKKPKVDILFKQEGLREIKGLVVIKYFDWMKYLIIGLTILILVLMIVYIIKSFINRKTKRKRTP